LEKGNRLRRVVPLPPLITVRKLATGERCPRSSHGMIGSEPGRDRVWKACG
jgi:hypothetical protein